MRSLGRHDPLDLELVPQSVARPAAGSLALHVVIFGGLAFYAFLSGLFHHNSWGGAGAGGAIQVSLVSSAIPLPQDARPNNNVLSTDTPSQAPVEAQPKSKQEVDETAIALKGHNAKKPQPLQQQKTQQPTQTNRAQYGEQAGSQMARQTQSGAIGPTVVGDGDFGSRFGWYVAQINAKMAQSWYKAEVDPRTPRGTRVYLVFTIRHDGSPANVQIDKSSGAPSLDRSCQRGVQRVDSFGTLPQGYNQSTLQVSYYCEY